MRCPQLRRGVTNDALVCETMADEHSDDDLRVGNPERERAVALLNDAFAAGYLDVTEFEERSGRVYAARTRGDLRESVADLPAAGQLFPGTASVAPTPAAAPPRQASYDADWGTIRRKGSWTVDQRMLFTGSMSTVDLDFTAAVFPASRIDVELHVSVATVKIKIGPDQEIRFDDLVKSGWSTIKDKSGPPTRQGGPFVNLHGSVSAASSVVIKRSGSR